MDHEGSFNGLAFGPGTDYRVRTLRWWRRSTQILTPDLPRYHGGLVGASYESARQIEVEFIVRGGSPDELVDRFDTLFSAFAPMVDEELPFIWTAPGHSARRVLCRPIEDGGTNITFEDWVSSSKQISFRLVASDPAIYDNALLVATLEPFTSAEGFAWPAVWPISWGAGGSGGGASITNTGDWETWPVFKINGPASGTMTDPVVESVTLGERLALTANGGVSISSGQVLIIDTHPARRSIAFSTGASRRGKLSTDSVWFPLQPGANELRFRASGTVTGATVDVEARSARI